MNKGIINRLITVFLNLYSINLSFNVIYIIATNEKITHMLKCKAYISYGKKDSKKRTRKTNYNSNKTNNENHHNIFL